MPMLRCLRSTEQPPRCQKPNDSGCSHKSDVQPFRFPQTSLKEVPGQAAQSTAASYTSLRVQPGNAATCWVSRAGSGCSIRISVRRCSVPMTRLWGACSGSSNQSETMNRSHVTRVEQLFPKGLPVARCPLSVACCQLPVTASVSSDPLQRMSELVLLRLEIPPRVLVPRRDFDRQRLDH